MQHNVIQHDQLTYSRGPAQLDAEALIHSYSQMVRRTAWHVHSRMSNAIEVEDLMQIGMIALVEAGRTFEDRGFPFAPYASTRVRGAMIDELRREARMTRAGMVNRRKLAATRARLESELGRAVNDAEMAEAMGLDNDAYHAMVSSSRAVKQDSINEAYSDHDMWFADATDSADSLLEKSQFSAMLAENISKLSEQEALVLNLYFVEEMNLEEIGQTIGVGGARICQIKKAALGKLRVLMSDE